MPTPSPTPAGIYNPALEPSVGRGEGISIIQTFLKNFITFGFIVGIVTSFAFLLLGAINWITAGGDREQLQKAQGKITNAILGLFVLFCLYAIIKIIETVFGLSLLKLDLTPLLLI